MVSVTDLNSNFGDIIELQSLNLNFDLIRRVLLNSNQWHQYNPRKEIKRYGLSVTSLDGSQSGIPDLDSLREFNREKGTNYTESDFKVRTPIVEQCGMTEFLDIWASNLGRSHFLRLDAGGFFPPHRDNGIRIPAVNMRIVVPIIWPQDSVFWIYEGKPITLKENTGYYINTSKIHSLFSYVDNATMLILNVSATPGAILEVAKRSKIL